MAQNQHFIVALDIGNLISEFIPYYQGVTIRLQSDSEVPFLFLNLLVLPKEYIVFHA